VVGSALYKIFSGGSAWYKIISDEKCVAQAI